MNSDRQSDGLELFVKKRIRSEKLRNFCVRYMYLPVIVLLTVVALICSQLISKYSKTVRIPKDRVHVREDAAEEQTQEVIFEKLENVDPNQKINLNTASAALLDTLPGIGPVKASCIVKTREEMGGFRSVNDLLNVEGIGEKTLIHLKDRVFVK